MNIKSRSRALNNTGFYSTSILIDTKGKGIPPYVSYYLMSLLHEHKHIHIKHFRQIKGTKYELAFKIKIDLDLKSFTDYMDNFLEENIYMYMTACKFDILCVMNVVEVPNMLIGVGISEGNYNYTFNSKDLNIGIEGVLASIFGIRGDDLNHARVVFDECSTYTVEKRVTNENVGAVDAYLTLLELDYERVNS